MEESTSREKILKKVRNALIDKKDISGHDVNMLDDVFENNNESNDITFANEFTNVAGKFIFCSNENEFVENLKLAAVKDMWENIFCFNPIIKDILTQAEISFHENEKNIFQAKVGITTCEFLIARTGSVLVSSNQLAGRRLNVFPEIHVIIAFTSQLVYDIKNAFDGIRKKYNDDIPSMMSVITGPSRTADIEKTLVMGAHGPKEVYVFLIENSD